MLADHGAVVTKVEGTPEATRLAVGARPFMQGTQRLLPTG
ncbi:hypothetical protein [Saccharopolyspora pogona]